jgi:hypothetical protein
MYNDWPKSLFIVLAICLVIDAIEIVKEVFYIPSLFDSDENVFIWIVTVVLYFAVILMYILRDLVFIRSLRTLFGEESNKRVMHIRLFTSVVILGIDLLSLFSDFNFAIVLELIVETILTLAVMHYSK